MAARSMKNRATFHHSLSTSPCSVVSSSSVQEREREGDSVDTEFSNLRAYLGGRGGGGGGGLRRGKEMKGVYNECVKEEEAATVKG